MLFIKAAAEFHTEISNISSRSRSEATNLVLTYGTSVDKTLL